MRRWHLVPVPHQLLQGRTSFRSHVFLLVSCIGNVGYRLSQSLHTRLLVRSLFGLRYKDCFFLKPELVNLLFEEGGRSCAFSEDGLPKWYFTQWFGNEGNPLWDGMVNWRKIVGGEKVWPRHVYARQTMVSRSDGVTDI